MFLVLPGLPDTDPISLTPLITMMEMANQMAKKLYQDYLNGHKLEIETKQDHQHTSPVTNADLVINGYLTDSLLKAFPDIPILSEENRERPYKTRKNDKLYWCLDPIDGTKEFINKNGEFTINVGLVYDETPVLGLVGYPVKDIIYYASQGQGAYKIQNNKTHLLKTRERQTPPTIICSRSHRNQATTEYLEQYPEYQQVNRGSSLKFMAIAEGQADIYPRLVGSMEWDTCASHIIVTEAGGTISLVDNPEQTLTYNKEDLLNPYFVVYG